MKEYIMIKETGNAPITIAELIRCKDCKFHHASEILNKCWCEKDFIDGLHNRDWFCADGERWTD